MKLLFTSIGVTVGGIFMFCFAGAIFSLPVYWLWNWLMPMIFGLTKITWFQAWGLNVLCSFLFKTSVTTKDK
jgi:hypothetical protein